MIASHQRHRQNCHKARTQQPQKRHRLWLFSAFKRRLVAPAFAGLVDPARYAPVGRSDGRSGGLRQERDLREAGTPDLPRGWVWGGAVVDARNLAHKMGLTCKLKLMWVCLKVGEPTKWVGFFWFPFEPAQQLQALKLKLPLFSGKDRAAKF